MKVRYVVSLALAGAFAFTLGSSAQGQMPMPKMATIRGTVVDLTCASKAYAMGMKWVNTKENHMLEGGKAEEKCATMCLQGGQPAAVFNGSTLTAVLACNPRATLAKYASKEVELQGFWAADDKDVKTFVPQKVRAGSGAWTDVDCATMH